VIIDIHNLRASKFVDGMNHFGVVSHNDMWQPFRKKDCLFYKRIWKILLAPIVKINRKIGLFPIQNGLPLGVV
jgi:hypothetical protein